MIREDDAMLGSAQGTNAPMRDSPAAELVRLQLAGSQELLVDHGQNHSRLRILGPDGAVRLAIEITAEGPVLRIEGTGVKLEVAGKLALEAETLALVGRRELALCTSGDLRITAQGDLHSTARIQNISAELGNVNVKANDDVKLNGERVMVNC
jgi:hypothetical protein